MKLKKVGELELIRSWAKKITLTDPRVLEGIGDDAAVLKQGSGNKLLLFTIDTLIEDIHFTKKLLTPYQIGQKALAVNLSDIAAMGGIPLYALISAGLSPETSTHYAGELYRGIRTLAKKHRVSIVGGDTVASSGKLTLTVTLLGEVERKYLTRRSGARKGDKILVTGNLGGAAAGRLAGKYFPSRPPCAEIQKIVKKFKPTSMIDLSDGLATDLRHICRSSRVGAKIWSEKIPLSRRTREIARSLGRDPFKLALTGGEDYEFLFTLPEKKVRKLLARRNQVRISLIGEITGRKGSIFKVDKKGRLRPLLAKGYEHF